MCYQLFPRHTTHIIMLITPIFNYGRRRTKNSLKVWKTILDFPKKGESYYFNTSTNMLRRFVLICNASNFSITESNWSKRRKLFFSQKNKKTKKTTTFTYNLSSDWLNEYVHAYIALKAPAKWQLWLLSIYKKYK